jgi:hypothetical protein
MSKHKIGTIEHVKSFSYTAKADELKEAVEFLKRALRLRFPREQREEGKRKPRLAAPKATEGQTA